MNSDRASLGVEEGTSAESLVVSTIGHSTQTLEDFSRCGSWSVDSDSRSLKQSRFARLSVALSLCANKHDSQLDDRWDNLLARKETA